MWSLASLNGHPRGRYSPPGCRPTPATRNRAKSCGSIAVPRQSDVVFHRAATPLIFALAAMSLSGCKSIAALKQRCLSGDAASCESACAKGIAGEGGCFHAGNRHREVAALDFAGSEFRRASEYFVRSCDGGYGDGCLMAAEMIEAPYAPDPAFDGPAPPKTISDKEVRSREKRLELACLRRSSRGCKRLGDVLIGKSAERAKSAYVKACDAGASPAECKNARGAEVDQAESWRLSCMRRVADDCARLGDLLYQVDPPRAVRLFESECELRGVAEIVGGVAHFVHDRIEEARYATLSPAAAPPAGRNTPPRHSFDVLSPAIQGPVAVSEVLHAFVVNAPELSACIDLDPDHAPPELALELVVDVTGDVFRARASSPAAAARVTRCIESVARSMMFGQPSAPAAVTLTLKVHDSKPP